MKNDRRHNPEFSRRHFVKASAAGLGGMAALAGLDPSQLEAAEPPERWDNVADVVVIGAGAAGLPAAISAAEHGASVILIEQNDDIGGHAIQSGGAMALGGGSKNQTQHGIEDSPEQWYNDLINWHDYRFSDREIVWAFAQESGQTLDWLVEKGVVLRDTPPSNPDGGPTTVPRTQRPLWNGPAGGPSPTGTPGTALVRPLEAAARRAGVQLLLEHSLTDVFRQTDAAGRVVGVRATTRGQSLTIQARRGVIVATGGHSSNVPFRQTFDPRLTEEYQVVGDPYSLQTGDGEIAGMRVGAALWGAANQTLDTLGRTHVMEKPVLIGSQFGYLRPGTRPTDDLITSTIFSKVRATGLPVKDHQNVIHVNQAGVRFVNEEATGWTWWDACMAPNARTPVGGNGGGPIWAIFDAEAATREGWVCSPPYVDLDGWFFSANTIEDLAAKVVCTYQQEPLPTGALVATVARYNGFVDAGHDADFGKATPQFKVQTPPFYAAWSTPCVHDCLSGLRIDSRAQVIDWTGNVIPGLYCAGESAGGFNQHGLAKCLVFGRIAGREAARNPGTSSAPEAQ
jgi:urocanate reductase